MFHSSNISHKFCCKKEKTKSKKKNQKKTIQSQKSQSSERIIIMKRETFDINHDMQYLKIWTNKNNTHILLFTIIYVLLDQIYYSH